MLVDYEKLLSIKRMRVSSIVRENKVDEFYSDRSRIIYSSSFRRLQQKAQVFSLEPNSSVRTRLTHSIEVSDLGRTLANKIGYKLYEAGIINERMVPVIVAVVENACLLHDIGNPPFGHFGEAAIQEWARTNLESLASSAKVSNDSLFMLLTSDFREFDGNPQGFRIISKLHCEKDECSLNLTYATLLCGLKYARASGEEKGDGILKKAGYFQSEKNCIEKIYKDISMEKHHRYPLTYIMEAADDIAYCLSDISDGIEKRIITYNDFSNEFQKIWKEEYGDIPCPVEIPESTSNFSMDVSVKWSKKIIEEAADNYIKNHDSFYNGTANQLICEDGLGQVLEIIKQVSRKLLYKSDEAENIELAGYAVITGLLNNFSRLLSLEFKDFNSLIRGTKAPSGNALDLEKRLFNRLGERYVRSYIYETKRLDQNNLAFKVEEWWLRTHLIIDHINGMTDDFALATYQMLTGIKTNIY